MILTSAANSKENVIENYLAVHNCCNSNVLIVLPW